MQFIKLRCTFLVESHECVIYISTAFGKINSDKLKGTCTLLYTLACPYFAVSATAIAALAADADFFFLPSFFLPLF